MQLEVDTLHDHCVRAVVARATCTVARCADAWDSVTPPAKHTHACIRTYAHARQEPPLGVGPRHSSVSHSAHGTCPLVTVVADPLRHAWPNQCASGSSLAEPTHLYLPTYLPACFPPVCTWLTVTALWQPTNQLCCTSVQPPVVAAYCCPPPPTIPRPPAHCQWQPAQPWSYTGVHVAAQERRHAPPHAPGLASDPYPELLQAADPPLQALPPRESPPPKSAHDDR